MAEDTDTAPAPAAGGFAGALARRYGPLPGWAWAGLAGAAAVGIIWWRRRSAKATGAGTDAAGTDQTAADQGLSAGMTADELAAAGGSFAVLQSEIQQLQGQAATHQTTGTPPAPAGNPKPPSGTGTPTPPGHATHYVTVTVQPFTSKNPPWQSTLSGIAAHYNVPGGYQALAKLNGISDPNIIHPGQQIKVPVT